MKIAKFKSHFAGGSEYTHLNNSGQCLIPDVYKNLAMKWLERLSTEGAHCSLEGWAQTEVTRAKLARFLGADVDEVSYFTTTASALSQAAAGIPLKAGDEILTWEQEYPSNFYPWRLAAERSGAKLIQVESLNYETPAEKLLEKVTDKTKVIAISWVQYQTGAVTDLKYLSEKLKGSGIWLVADVIQGVGVRPLNFHESGFDIICGGSHKFLCSGFGAGYMAIKKEQMLYMAPLEVGAMTFGNPETKKSFTIDPRQTASRFEPGTKSLIEIIALGATLDLFLETGIENIYQEACRLQHRLAKGLRQLRHQVIAPEGPILSLVARNEAELEKMTQKLSAEKVSFAKRGPGIRLSTHAYNTDEEMDRVLNTLS